MPDPLVTTKVRVPRTRPELVPRPRLREPLARYEGRRLTLVSAPAGFGKTTLLSEWLEDRSQDGRPVAWLSLEEADNDPARFLAYLVRALRSDLGEGIGEGVVASLRSPEFPPVEAIVGALINELAAVRHEVTIVPLVAAGKSNGEIASILFVSLSTVKTHINNLYRKLGARSRTHA